MHIAFQILADSIDVAANLTTYQYGPLVSCASWLWARRDGKLSGEELYELQFPHHDAAQNE